MDASGGAARKVVAAPGTGPTLRLRRAGSEAVDWVTDTFLGGQGSPAEPGIHCVEAAPAGTTAEAPGTKPLPLRGVSSQSVTIGVEPSGRVCLEVHVGGGAAVASVLRELEEAERRLRASAHEAAMAPVAARVDLSQPVRRRVILEGDAQVPPGVWARAGFEVG